MLAFKKHHIIYFFAIPLLLLVASPVMAQQRLETLMMQAQQNIREGNFARAEDQLLEIVKSEPENVKGHQLLVATYLQQKDGEMAVEYGKKALNIFPDDNWIKWLAGEAFLMNKALPEALNQFLEVQQGNAFEKSGIPGSISHNDLKNKIGNIYRMMGAGAIQSGKYEKAAHQYLNAQKYLPEEVQSYTSLAYVFSRRNDWDKVIQWADQGLKKFPEHPDLVRLKAQAYFNTNDNEGLMVEYRKLYKQNPEDIDIALAYTEVLIANKKLKEALTLYEDLMDKFPKERRVYEALLEVNEQFMNIKGKIAVLKKMRQHFPEDPQILKSMAKAYSALEDWKKTGKVYDTLSHIDSLSIWAKKQMAEIYIHQDSLSLAGAIYEELLVKHPENHSIILAKGKLMENQGNWSSALALYKKIRHGDKAGLVMTRLGYVYEQLKKYQKAREAFRMAMAQNTVEPMVYFRLGRLQLHHDSEEAFSLLGSAITRGLNKIENLQQTLMGFMQEEQDRLANPIENQKMAEEIESNTQVTEKAIVLLSENFAKERVNELISRMISEYPASARLYYLAGNHYQSHREYREAINWYRQAVRKSPDLPEVHLALGQAHEQQEQTQKAILAYERVLALDENREEAYEALIRLYREEAQLSQLWQKWRARHRARPGNEMLKDHLIEALHKDGQYDLSREIIEGQD